MDLRIGERGLRPGSDTALLTPLHPPLLLTPFSPQARTSFSQQQLHQHLRVSLRQNPPPKKKSDGEMRLPPHVHGAPDCVFQFNMEQKRREQEQHEKQQELQQLKHKDKSQQSE